MFVYALAASPLTQALPKATPAKVTPDTHKSEFSDSFSGVWLTDVLRRGTTKRDTPFSENSDCFSGRFLTDLVF